MNDVFGNALQKLAAGTTSKATDAVSLTHLNETMPEDSAASNDKDSNIVHTHSDSGLLPIECRGPEAVLAREPEALERKTSETESHAGVEPGTESPCLAPLTDVVNRRTLKSILLQNPLPFLQAHRRRVAAAVVLFCMALLWSEENTSTRQQPFVEPAAEMTSVESLLEDFATIDSRKMKDQAEPVNVSAPLFELTIPSSTAQTSLSSSQDSASSTGVRFTGRIQPLK